MLDTTARFPVHVFKLLRDVQHLKSKERFRFNLKHSTICVITLHDEHCTCLNFKETCNIIKGKNSVGLILRQHVNCCITPLQAACV